MPSGPRGEQAYCTRGALPTRLNGQRAARGGTFALPTNAILDAMSSTRAIGSAFGWCRSLARRVGLAQRRNRKGAGRRNRAARQMESRSWGNLTRRAGDMRPSGTGQTIGRTGCTVLHSAEQRLIGEMKGTPPERSHVPTATHRLAVWITNCAAAAGCRGNLPVGSLSFGAPASTFHSDAHPLLLLASRIVALCEQKGG